MGNCSCGKKKGAAKDKEPRMEGMEEEAVAEAAAKSDELQPAKAQPAAVKAEMEAGKEAEKEEGGKADTKEAKKEGTEEKETEKEETKTEKEEAKKEETEKEDTEKETAKKKEKAKKKRAKRKKAKKEESEKKEAEKGKESKTEETEAPKEPGKELKKEPQEAEKTKSNKEDVSKDTGEEVKKETPEKKEEAGKEEEPKKLETMSKEVKKDAAEKNEEAEKEKVEQELEKKEETKKDTESKEAEKVEAEKEESADERTQRTIVAEAMTPKKEAKKEAAEKEKAEKEEAAKEESADERTQRTIVAEATTPKTEVTQKVKAKKKEKRKKTKRSDSSTTRSTDGRTQSDEESSSEESLTDLISRSMSETSLTDGKKAPAKAKPAFPEKPKQWPMEPWGSTEHTSCVEFRIRLPLSVAEYEKAQIHTVNESSKKVTGSGNGVEVVRTERFGPRTENNAGPLPYGLAGNSGVFTEKVYRLKPLVPAAIRVLLSDDLMTMEERAWNAYPLCKTVIANRKWSKEDCLVLISTNYVSGGDAELPNALNLPAELLKIRTVHHLDITDDGLIGGRESANYKAAEDPKKLVTWNGRGPFPPGWEKSYKGPQMVIYKVVAVRFRFRFVETRLRAWMIEKTYPNLFAQTHRFAVCSYDVWSRLDIARLREMERETVKQLQEQMRASQGGPAMTFEA